MKLTILRKEHAQDSEFRSFFGRIEETINCFRELLTFNSCKSGRANAPPAPLGSAGSEF